MDEPTVGYIIRKIDEKYQDLTSEKTRMRAPRETAIGAVEIVLEQLQREGVIKEMTDIGEKDTPGIRFVAADAHDAIHVRCMEAKQAFNPQADLECRFKFSTAHRSKDCVAGVKNEALMPNSPVIDLLIELIAETKAAAF